MRTYPTDPYVLDLLVAAAKHPMTKLETRANKISYVLGMLPERSAVTRELIESLIDD